MILMLQEILGYFFIGLVAIPVIAVFYLPVYFILRKKNPLSQQIPYFLLTVCILVILMATVLGAVISNMMDGRGFIADRHVLNIIPFQAFTEDWLMGEEKKITQIIANILMFVPLGFIFPVAFAKMRRWWKTVLCMAAFSFLIEFVQYFIGRSADIDDFLLNTTGGLLGYFVFCLFFRLLKKYEQ